MSTISNGNDRAVLANDLAYTILSMSPEERKEASRKLQSRGGKFAVLARFMMGEIDIDEAGRLLEQMKQEREE